LRTPRRKDAERLAAMRERVRSSRDEIFLERVQRLFNRPELDFAGYAELFAGAAEQISGDITPGYSTLPDALVKEITAALPDAKILFLARDPVERAWSHLSMWIRHGRITQFDPHDLEQVSRQLSRPEVMARSFPTQIVTRWRRHAGAARFRVFFFDDLKRDSAGMRKTIIEFLGGDPGKVSGLLSADHNPKAKLEKLELTDAVRSHLAQFFRDELRSCAQELGGPAAGWPARYGL
jgi:hypothetical protein